MHDVSRDEGSERKNRGLTTSHWSSPRSLYADVLANVVKIEYVIDDFAFAIYVRSTK